MSFLDKFLKKKPTASGDALKQTSGNTPKKAAGSGPKTDEYSPGGSPIYRYEDHRDEGFQPPEDVRVYAKLVEDHFEKLFPDRGHFVYHEIASSRVHIDIHVIRPTAEHNYYVVYTTGMSDLPMTLPDGLDNEDLKYGELYMYLPGDWDTGEDMEDFRQLPESSCWPFTLLRFLAHFPHEYRTWLGFGHTMPNGPDYAPICEGLGFGGVVLDWFGDKYGRVETPDGHDILCYMVIPAYKEEIEYKLKYGMEGLSERFKERDLPIILDVTRPNYCADFHEVLD